MPRDGCLALHGVNPNKKNTTHQLKWRMRVQEEIRFHKV